MKRSPVILALVASLIVTTDGQADENPGPDTSQNTRELERLQGEIRNTRSELTSARREKQSLEKQLRRTETEISTLGRDLRRLKKKLVDQRKRLTTLSNQKDSLKKQLGNEQAVLDRQLQAHYLTARQSHLKLLLKQQNPADIGRAMVYFDYLNQSRSRQILAIQDSLHDLDALEQDIAAQTRRISQTLNKHRQAHRSLSKQRSERKRILARFSSQIDDRDKQLQGLLANERELLALVGKIARKAQKQGGRQSGLPAFASLKGRLILPTQGSLRARFGSPRNIGKLRWQGMLLAAEPGREVHAISHGKVVFADWLKNFGLLIILDHGDGYMSLYGHNDTLLRDTGEEVGPGDVIATVGNSGGQKKTGLYLEIRHNGTPLNPHPWFAHR